MALVSFFCVKVLAVFNKIPTFALQNAKRHY